MSSPEQQPLGQESRPEFEDVFSRLKQMVSKHGSGLTIEKDSANEFILTGPLMERWQKHLWFGGVRMGKRYVSLHLMPVYMFPDLLDMVSPTLKARMQGKSCFNFRKPDSALFAELDRLVLDSMDRLRSEGILDPGEKGETPAVNLRTGNAPPAAQELDPQRPADRKLQRPIQPMPDLVEAALQEQRLMPAYLDRPPYQRNDYLGWISRAKRQQTREKRMLQMLAELKIGDRYMGMPWKPAAPRPKV